MKAAGYNAVCMYFNWSYHSPAPGVYDFTGVRDMDLVLRMAADTGLYVLARPGPYINGELNAGGFPGWLTRTAAVARTDDPVYLGYADEWLTAIDAILARHQLTDGGGTVLLYQIENEYASYVTSATGINYMSPPVRQGPRGRHHRADLPQRQGPQRLLAAGQLPRPGQQLPVRVRRLSLGQRRPAGLGLLRPGRRQGRGQRQPGHAGVRGGVRRRVLRPVGRRPWQGQGYSYERAFDGPAYERQFYLTNVANGIKLQNVYMTFGGTSWGWLPAPVVYTSYDYGAAISEARQLTAKIPAMKEMGYFLQSVPDINKIDKASPVTASNPLLVTYHLANPDTGTQFYFVRNDHTADQTFTLPVSAAGGSYTVPQSGALQLDGKDLKVIVADYQLDSAHLVYSTSHLMTHAPLGSQDVAVLASRPGDDGETVLRYPAAATGPQVSVLDRARRGDQLVGRQHRGPAARLHPPGRDPDAGHPGGRRPAAAPAGRGRHRGRDVLAAGHRGRPGAGQRARTGPHGRGPRSGARAHRGHQRGHAAGGLGAPAGRPRCSGTGGRCR